MSSQQRLPLLVIFDIDGVLIDFRHLKRGYRTSNLLGFGMTVDEAEAGAKLWDDFIEAGHDPRDVKGLVGRVASHYGYPDTEYRQARGYERRRRFLTSELKANAGMVEVVHWLAAQPDNFLLGVASNGGLDDQLNKLEQIGLLSVFPRDAIIILPPNDPNRKPDPYSINEIRNFYGAISADGTVLIGDRPDTDIKAANNAGVNSILFIAPQEETDSPNEVLGAEATFVATSASQLRSHIIQLYLGTGRETERSIA